MNTITFSISNPSKSMNEYRAEILIADDEEDILELLKYNLEQEGFKVHTAVNGQQAFEIAISEKPDLIILDVMMPIMDGYETAEKLKKEKSTRKIPFLFLTARSEEENEIKGLNLGADDYIHKPIKTKILNTRIKSLLRRLEPQSSDLLSFPHLTIDKPSHKVILNDKEIKLAKKEFKLLHLLASQPGRVFGREEIMSKVWGNEVIVGDRTIDVHIRKLRSKLGIDCIETVKGLGYKFIYNN